MHGTTNIKFPEIKVQAISVFFKVSPRKLIKMYQIARGFCCFTVDEHSKNTTDEGGSGIYSDYIHILYSALFTNEKQ